MVLVVMRELGKIGAFSQQLVNITLKRDWGMITVDDY